MKKSIYFYLAVLTIFLGICSPLLFAHGMFVDGVFYSTIARNMAWGKGSFWSPQFSETLFPAFHEQPPFALWIESIFFSIFGSSIFVERFYSVFAIILVGFLIVKIWKEITSETITAWFPLLLFVSIPVITWAATNNMLENTMSIFVCCSALFYLRRIRRNKYFFLILSGLSLFFGVFSKGIVALFPWTLPLLICIFSKKISFKHALQDTLILMGCTIIPFVAIYFLSSQAKLFFDAYIQEQLLSSIAGNRETAGTRFHIITKLLENLIPCIILGLIILIILIIKKKTYLFKTYKNSSLIFLSLSLCGILPIMLSAKQSGFYIVPAYPFMAIALALPFQPYLKILMDKIQVHSKGFLIFKIMSFILLISVIFFSLSQYGKIARNKKELQTVFACNKYIPENSRISVDFDEFTNWGLQSYFARYQNICLDTIKGHTYYLQNQNTDSVSSNENYIPIIDVENFMLLKKIQ